MQRRWNQHKTQKGAKYFRGRTPETLRYIETAEDRSAASKREYIIKQLSRKDKQALLESGSKDSERLISELEIE